jgi:hypothetical protein
VGIREFHERTMTIRKDAINSIDDLESVEIRELKELCAALGPDVIAIAMHGISPALAARLRRAMPLIRGLGVRLSPYKRKAVKLETLERAHREIVSKFNDLCRR